MGQTQRGTARRERLQRGTRKLLGYSSPNIWITSLLDYGDFMNLYSLTMCSLLHVNYSSTKTF